MPLLLGSQCDATGIPSWPGRVSSVGQGLADPGCLVGSSRAGHATLLFGRHLRIATLIFVMLKLLRWISRRNLELAALSMELMHWQRLRLRFRLRSSILEEEVALAGGGEPEGLGIASAGVIASVLQFSGALAVVAE